MDVIPQSILLLGIIPAIFFLYLSLKGYDGLYKEKYIFLTFVLGLATGFIGVLIEILTALEIGILFMIMFPITHTLIKTIVINFPRFHGKKDTIIYGMSLGIGYGSIFTPYMIFSLSRLFDEYPSYGDQMILLILCVIGSCGMILFHGATGILLGYGVATKNLKNMFIYSIILYMPLTIIFISYEYFLRLEIGYIIILLYGIVLYWYTNRIYLPHAKEQKSRRKKTKEKSKK